MKIADEPDLTYDGNTSSGHSGSAASHDRALAMDADGTTALLQRRVLRLVAAAGEDGVTVAEVRQTITDHHHGSLSGALSNMHRAGTIARLLDKRGRCHIYVLPEYVGDRVASEPGVNIRTSRRVDLVESIRTLHTRVSVPRSDGRVQHLCRACRTLYPCPTVRTIDAYQGEQ